MMQACKNCRFSIKTSGHSSMIWRCRRRSPKPVPKPSYSEQHQQGAWPDISETDWCGEWEAVGSQKPAPEPETAQERMFKWFWR